MGKREDVETREMENKEKDVKKKGGEYLEMKEKDEG